MHTFHYSCPEEFRKDELRICSSLRKMSSSHYVRGLRVTAFNVALFALQSLHAETAWPPQPQPTLETHVHALDRVLLWGYYGIPAWYGKTSRFAYWNKFGRPAQTPNDGVGFSAWWVDPALEAKLKR